jgi:hypothetical protein
MGVFHPTRKKKGEKTSVGDVMGRIRRRIALSFFKRAPPTQIPTNLAPIIKRMAMM